MPILNLLVNNLTRFAFPGGIDVESSTNVISDGYVGESAITIRHIEPAVIHILKGRELLILDEGDRDKEAIQVFVGEPIYTVNPVTGARAEVIRYTPTGEGVVRRYEVKISEDWLGQSGHYRVTGVRIPDA